MQERIRTDAARTTLVCVDSFGDSVLAGRFYNLGQEGDGHPFRSTIQLLNGIEQILDNANFPQSFTAVRAFGPAPEKRAMDSAESRNRKGKLATFSVKVLFRQHTSWQGSVTWLEQDTEQPFRSVLELLLLMDSALSESEA